ncbi:hypothetical protein M3Y97_00029300 [Aphelenchoides bicaudatus]|nr:hypothetical protein M3Y97_00029300 [Aphelenchoides bicaudatus]
MDWSTISFICSVGLIGRHRFAIAQSFDIVPHEPHPQQQSVETWHSSTEEEEPSMWPYPTYKPISWQKYYTNDSSEKHISLTSGLAAGITIGVFFAVFLLTFGCRLYSQRSDNLRRFSSRSTQSTRNFCQRRPSVSDFFSCSSIPPPYDVAIRMPNQGEPPPYTVNDSITQGNARPV